MAYDEVLAGRIRDILDGRDGVVEKPMFGGLTFMLRGNMCCGVAGDDLMLRVGPERSDAAARRPHARPCDFTGRPLRGLVMVAPEGYASDAALEEWVAMAVAFAESLPAK